MASGGDRVAVSFLARSDQRSTSDFTRASQALLVCSYASNSSFCRSAIASVCAFPKSKNGVDPDADEPGALLAISIVSAATASLEIQYACVNNGSWIQIKGPALQYLAHLRLLGGRATDRHAADMFAGDQSASRPHGA